MKLKKWTALLLTAAMVFTLAACGGKDTVVARIDDTEITATQLDKFVALSSYAAGQDLSALEGQAEYLQYLKKAMLSNIISYEAMRLSLEKEGTTIFPEDYDAQLKEFLTEAKENIGEFLKAEDIDDDTLTYYFNLNYYAAPFSEKALAKVGNEAVKEYYEKNKASFTLQAAEGHVSHIVVEKEATANEIYDKLVGGGDFAELAAEYGTDGTKDNGGSLGVVAENATNLDADFLKGAFTLKSGEFSKPVKTSFGYHLIKMEDRKEAGTLLTFAEVEESIHQNLATAEYSTIIAELLTEYKVEYLGDYADKPEDDTTGGAIDEGGEDQGNGVE